MHQNTEQSPADGPGQYSADELEAANALLDFSRTARFQDFEPTHRQASPLNEEDIEAAHILLQMSRDTRDIIMNDEGMEPASTHGTIQGLPRAASPINYEDVDAAFILLQLSRDTWQPEQQTAQHAVQQLVQQADRDAIWTLHTFGRTLFFNSQVTQNFSQEEIVAMRNQGEITEDDFFGAFSANANNNAPPALRAFLDPSRPRVLASTNLFPPVSFRSSRRRNAIQDAIESVGVKQADGDEAGDEPETTDDAEQSDVPHVRPPLKAGNGPPKWDYLHSFTKDDAGTIKRHIYKSKKSGKEVTPQDFESPEFCRDVNRWFRQLHRRKGAARMKRQIRWSSREKRVLEGLLKERGRQSWEQVAKVFNKRMGFHGKDRRTSTALKSMTAKRKQRASNPDSTLRLRVQAQTREEEEDSDGDEGDPEDDTKDEDENTDAAEEHYEPEEKNRR